MKKYRVARLYVHLGEATQSTVVTYEVEQDNLPYVYLIADINRMMRGWHEETLFEGTLAEVGQYLTNFTV